MQKKIILDCDPGHDDAIAMLLAYGNKNIDLLAVTTVAGNQSIEKVTHNALAIASVANIKNVLFARGSAKPLVRTQSEFAAYIHGESGLDGVKLPNPIHTLETQSAVNLIIETIMNSPPQSITLVPTGALTNIALAAKLEPRIIERVKEVVLMGGGAHIGNCTPVAEFNIKTDPEAAYVVFNEKWNITMIGLDLTHQALATNEVMQKISALNTKPAEFVCNLMEFYGKMYKKEHRGFDECPPVHDPCAVAYVIDKSLFQTKRVPINIELNGTYTLGMTVCDFRYDSYENCHTQVALKLNHSKFWDLIIDALKNIGEVDFKNKF